LQALRFRCYHGLIQGATGIAPHDDLIPEIGENGSEPMADDTPKNACELRASGQYELAWKAVLSLLEGGYADTDTLVVGAEIGLFAGEERRSLELLELAMHLAPGRMETLVCWVTVSLKVDGLRKTIRSLNQMCEETPHGAEGWILLGNLLELAGHPSEAEDAYTQALSANIKEEKALADLRRLWRGGTLEENPFSAAWEAIFLNEARRLARECPSEGAAARLEKWAERFNKNPEFAHLAMECGAHLQRPERSDWEGVNRVLAEWVEGDFDLAQTDIPGQPEPWYEEARRALDSGQREEAFRALEKTLEHSPEHPGALFALGVERLKAGQYDAAVEPLARLAAMDASDPEVLSRLAIAYTQLRQWEKALEAWGKVLILSPGNSQASGNIARIEHFLKRPPLPSPHSGSSVHGH
jgi:tetratricopeptide (TPR) repeat protein